MKKLKIFITIIFVSTMFTGCQQKQQIGNEDNIYRQSTENENTDTQNIEIESEQNTTAESIDIESLEEIITQTIMEEEHNITINDINKMPAGSIVEKSVLSTFSNEEVDTLFYAEEISDEIYQRIVGYSYKENENISINELSYIRVLHVGFDEQTHIGELIVNDNISDDILEIMRKLYESEYPIEKMILIDEYGADDDISMEENNTSAFNYRVVQGTDKLSKHSYGLAIDINPLYNPYVKNNSDGSLYCSPEISMEYADREKDFPYKIDKEDLCYKLFTEHGFKWGGDWKSIKDYQHFQKE